MEHMQFRAQRFKCRKGRILPFSFPLFALSGVSENSQTCKPRKALGLVVAPGPRHGKQLQYGNDSSGPMCALKGGIRKSKSLVVQQTDKNGVGFFFLVSFLLSPF